jgi:hypothetical protein
MHYFLNPRVNADRISQDLQSIGLDVPSLSEYGICKQRSGLVFGFTAYDLKTIKASVAKVACILKQS